jgi:hypothetical protein
VRAGVPASGDMPPAEHVDHRRAFRDFVLAEAEPWHREHLTRLYALWEEWNERFYGGALEPPYLLLATTSIPACYGDCGVWSGFGGRSQIRIRRSLLTGMHPDMAAGERFAEGRFLFVADVLLHEQIHQFHQEVTGRTDDGYHGHGPAFRDTANRIGAQLGLSPVRTCKRRGPDRDRPSCSQWPHDVRPDDFYLGADVRAERARDNGRASPLAVTLHGDPSEVAARLLDALHKLPLDAQNEILAALGNRYRPTEAPER